MVKTKTLVRLLSQVKDATSRYALSSILSFNKLQSFVLVNLNIFFGRRPSSYPFISGDGFRKIADHIWENDNKELLVDNIGHGDIIFCEANLLNELYTKVLSEFSHQIILILGNSDTNFFMGDLPKDLQRKTLAIFAQNLVEPISGAQPLPIGLENSWRANHGKIINFRFRRLLKKKKIMRVMWSFTVETNPVLRLNAYRALMGVSLADQFQGLATNAHRAALSSYGFVASPPGNGLDTHRTWEALYLRCIPIVLKSEMTERFFELGIPLWLVDSFEDLMNISSKDLQKKYKELESGFASDRLWMPYWIWKINSAKP